MATSGYKDVAVTSWNTLRFSWELTGQSIQNNNSTIKWTLKLIAGSSGKISSTASKDWSVTVNGTKYSGTNTIGVANNSTKTLASGATTIAHNSDGTKTFSYSFSQEFGITFSGSSIGTKSGSGTGTLTTIPRASTITSITGNTLGGTAAIVVKRESSAFMHTITYKCGSASGMVVTDSQSDEISWTLPLSLASQNTTGMTVSITFTITTKTKANSTTIGTSTKTLSCKIPTSVKPSVSLAISDATNTKSLCGTYVQGMSKLKVVATTSGAYGSTISKRYVTANGKTYTSDSFTTETIVSYGNLAVSSTVTDSRGQIAETSVSYTVAKYSAPKITNLSLKRCNADGSSNESGAYLAVIFSSEIVSVNAKNTPSYSIQYKKHTETEYTTKTMTAFAGQYTVSGGVFVFPAEIASSYDVILTVSDVLNTVTKSATGSSVKKLFSILRQGLGFAIGKIAELENVFDIGFKTRFSGGLLPLVLPEGTDVNDLFTPNQYIGMEAEEAGYMNLPFTDNASFSLEVLSAGEVGQVMQRCTLCRKADPIIYERFYYHSSWGEWVKVSDYGGTLLWSGGYYMTAGHSIPLAETVAEQSTGIVLVWSEFVNGAAVNNTLHTFFVPKMLVAKHGGNGHVFHLSTSNLAYYATKYLYISNDKIVGHDNNNLTGTGTCGITYTNARFVLRYVIGV